MIAQNRDSNLLFFFWAGGWLLQICELWSLRRFISSNYLPSGNQTWQMKISNSEMIFPLRSAFIGSFQLLRLIPGGWDSMAQWVLTSAGYEESRSTCSPGALRCVRSEKCADAWWFLKWPPFPPKKNAGFILKSTQVVGFYSKPGHFSVNRLVKI